MPSPFDDNPQSDANRRWKAGFSSQTWGCFSIFIAVLVILATLIIIGILWSAHQHGDL